jgi:hypothetical protein
VVVDASALEHLPTTVLVPALLTPHAGELAAMLGAAREDIERRPLQFVRAAAEKYDAVVLLKGRRTLVARPDGRVRANTSGTPWLATAGAGDVLGGITGALLAGGLTAYDAASVGAWLHGAAATLASDGGPARFDVLERVRVDDHGDVVRQGRGQLLTCRVAATGADHPGLDPALADDLGVVLLHGGCHGVIADVPHHPGQPARRTRHAEQRGTGVLRAARPDADDAARVLLGLRGRPGQQGRNVLGLERLHVWLGQVEPDVDEVHRPAGPGCWVHQVTDLVGAERDGEHRLDVVAVDLTGVDADAAGRVHGHDRYAVQQLERVGGVLPEPAAAADPDDAVDDDLGTPRRLGHDAPARGLERLPPRAVRVVA